MNNILAEAERLHALGFAVHWLREKSKVPYFPGWTKGGRATLKELKNTYKKGFNYGVRLGHASEIDGTFLAVIDVDVKSDKPHHQKEAEKALFKIFPEVREGPFIHSGRGNGSAHYYVRLKHPVSGDECKADSKEMVRVHMPSVAASKAEEETLDFELLAAGWRLRKAWEVSLLSEGRQCVLAGSIHPDTGRPYEWGREVSESSDIPLITIAPGKGSKIDSEASKKPEGGEGIRDWNFRDVALEELGLSEVQLDAIRDGAGVSDASAKVYELVLALLSRSVDDTVIVSVFTDKQFFLGQTSFKHARTKNRRYAAAWVERYCIRKAKIKIGDSDFDFDEKDAEPSDNELRRERSGKKKNQPPIGPEKILWPVGLNQPPYVWEKQLELKSRGKLLAPLVRISYTNILLILQNSCESSTFLRLDEFALKAHYTCDTPWGIPKNQQRSSGNEDALLLKGWLHRKYEMVPSVSLLDELLNSITIENSYHPVREYLDGLQWDGVARINSAFKTYLGAAMPEPYLSDVTRKFFIGAVKRIYEPGSTFQYMVVLEGEQGIGKSTAVSILASKRWFLDALPHLQDKDAALYLIGTWLCEIGELSALAKTDSGAAKAFISRDTDRIRPPYGARRIDYPRSTIFIGTTNPRDYLTDPTGNRRYWPVHCLGVIPGEGGPASVDFDGLERDRDQLWAEAATEFFFSHEKLFLEGRSLRQAMHIQELARAEDEIDLMVHDFRDWERDCLREEGRVPIQLNIAELFKTCWLNFRGDKASMMRGATALRQLGYDKHKKRGQYFWIKKSLKK